MARPRIFMGYVLRVEEGWSGDLLIVDCEDLENLSASEKKVKRFKHKEVAQEGNLSFPYADGSLKLFAVQWPPKDKNCDDWHPPFCLLLERGQCRSGTNCSFTHLSQDDPSSSPKCKPKSDAIKGSNMIAQDKVGGTLCRFHQMETIHPKSNLKRHKATGPK